MAYVVFICESLFYTFISLIWLNLIQYINVYTIYNSIQFTGANKKLPSDKKLCVDIYRPLNRIEIKRLVNIQNTWTANQFYYYYYSFFSVFFFVNSLPALLPLPLPLPLQFAVRLDFFLFFISKIAYTNITSTMIVVNWEYGCIKNHND